MTNNKPRYRVVGRDYIVFADETKVDLGKLVPKDTEVEDWMVDSGWVEEV